MNFTIELLFYPSQYTTYIEVFEDKDSFTDNMFCTNEPVIFYLFLVCTQTPGIQLTKGMAVMLVYTTKECNYNSIVIIHQ